MNQKLHARSSDSRENLHDGKGRVKAVEFFENLMTMNELLTLLKH
jgi:hypothetical protein